MGALAGYVCGLFNDSSDPEERKKGPKYAIVLFAVCAFIGCFCSLFIKEELRRLRPKETTNASEDVADHLEISKENVL